MKSEKQVGLAFEDHIRKVGAPVGLKSDNAKLFEGPTKAHHYYLAHSQLYVDSTHL